MTKTEKKERRKVRHELQAAVYRHHFSRDFKSSQTGAQMKAAAVKIADHLLAGTNPQYPVLLEVR